MVNKNILITSLVVAALIATFLFGTRMGENKSLETANDKPDIGKNIPQAKVPAATVPNFNPTPAPWNVPNAASGAPVGDSQPDRQKNLAELKEMQMAIAKSIQQNRNADPKQVIQMLDKIKQVNGSPIVNGVNIDHLRDTLVVANDAQAIALEMNTEAKKPGGPDPEKMKAYTQRLQQLQSQLLAAQPAMQATIPK